MKVVFANSAFVTVPERLVLQAGRWNFIQLKVRYGFVEHPKFGPVLIDTGYGPQVTVADNRGLFLKLYARVINPQLNNDELPAALLGKFGYDLASVKYVIVTHFHADHIAQLTAFPNAKFIVSSNALQFIKQRSDMKNIADGIFCELLPDDIEERLICQTASKKVTAPLSLGEGADIFGDGSMLAIDLPGHAHGQFGVCFPHLEVPLLYAVDAQWLNVAVLENRLPGPPASLVADDRKALKTSVDLVRRFAHHGGHVVLCHDPCDSRFDYKTGIL